MKISYSSIVASAAFVTTLLCLQPGTVQAGGQGFGKEVYQDSSKDIGLGRFSSNPFHVSVTVRGGYDDNVNLTSFDEQESFFTNLALGVTYNFGSPRTRISLNSGAGFTYYFDRDDGFTGNSDDFDVNVFVGFSIAHKVTSRWTLGANLYLSYQSQPDFQSFNNGAFNFGRQNQDFFFTVNKFYTSYAWTPRFSTLSSVTVGYTDYDSDAVSVFQDRVELTTGTEFRFLVMPMTTVVAEYRIGNVIYSETDDRDSTSYFILAGFDHSFSPRFNMSMRGGVEFRDYDDNGVFGIGNDESEVTSPYGEFTLNYAIAQNTAISWFNRYSIEESDVPELRNRRTYRTSVSLRHSFTPRITAGLNVAYQHDDYDGNAIALGFTEDSFDISLSLRYAINRNWALDAGYHHTQVVSDEALFREYSRNRVYGGFTFTF